jgi:hypothetical protein
MNKIKNGGLIGLILMGIVCIGLTRLVHVKDYPTAKVTARIDNIGLIDALRPKVKYINKTKIIYINDGMLIVDKDNLTPPIEFDIVQDTVLISGKGYILTYYYEPINQFTVQELN